jgi:hypothetical protein
LQRSAVHASSGVDPFPTCIHMPEFSKGVCGNYVRSGQLPMRATRKRVELVVDGTKGSNPAAEQHRVGKYIGLDAQC